MPKTGPKVEAVFVGEYAARYQRNNKRSGIKNLRCFPRCSLPHRTQGFCGQPVVVRFTIPLKLITKKVPNFSEAVLSATAEFRLKYENPPPNVGENISREVLMGKLRTRENPMNPWIIGVQTSLEQEGDKVCVEFEFNSVKKGWHYGWVSNKHTCEALHCLKVNVFLSSVQSSNDLSCISTSESPNFKIFCRRRSRPVQVDIGGAVNTRSITNPNELSNASTNNKMNEAVKPEAGLPYMSNLNSNNSNLFGQVSGNDLKNMSSMFPGITSQSIANGLNAGFMNGSLNMNGLSMTTEGHLLALQQNLLKSQLAQLGGTLSGSMTAKATELSDNNGANQRKRQRNNAPSSAVEKSDSLVCELISILSKVDLGEDGVFRPHPSITVDRLAFEIRSCVWKIETNKVPKNGEAKSSKQGDIQEIFNKNRALGIEVDSTKLSLINSLAEFLTSSSSFIETLKTMKASLDPMQPVVICQAFMKGVQDNLEQFLKSLDLSIQHFFVRFRGMNSGITASATPIQNKGQPLNIQETIQQNVSDQLKHLLHQQKQMAAGSQSQNNAQTLLLELLKKQQQQQQQNQQQQLQQQLQSYLQSMLPSDQQQTNLQSILSNSAIQQFQQVNKLLQGSPRAGNTTTPQEQQIANAVQTILRNKAISDALQSRKQNEQSETHKQQQMILEALMKQQQQSNTQQQKQQQLQQTSQQMLLDVLQKHQQQQQVQQPALQQQQLDHLRQQQQQIQQQIQQQLLQQQRNQSGATTTALGNDYMLKNATENLNVRYNKPNSFSATNIIASSGLQRPEAESAPTKPAVKNMVPSAEHSIMDQHAGKKTKINNTGKSKRSKNDQLLKESTDVSTPKTSKKAKTGEANKKLNKNKGKKSSGSLSVLASAVLKNSK